MGSAVAEGSVILWIVFWILIGPILGAAVGSGRGRTGTGFLLGLLLGIVGVIIVALLAPTPEKLAERDRAQARAIRDELASRGIDARTTQPDRSGVEPPSRQSLLAEAIRRDPTLDNAHDPATLKRLADTMSELEQEFRLRSELQQLRRDKALAAADAGMFEWQGGVIDAALDPREPQAWAAVVDGSPVADLWARIGMGTDEAGQLKLTATVWGQPVAELTAEKMADHPDLIEAVGKGVNVGVLRLDQSSGSPIVTLHLGRGYRNRPVPPWE